MGADDGDEESEVDELRASLRAWNTIAGPSSFTVEDELDRQFPDAATQVYSFIRKHKILLILPSLDKNEERRRMGPNLGIC